ncbi:hypothetical protein [Pedobacter cryoconitis]|uniref:Uncharacterized protein n=1 Tax=Pedobacter cryoconitis TaxID=188932 RepID=A0A327SEF3_9SPHI|nr:hypothetical protein [Pedobacter cryoconitis]RAJ26043.1 hypothetical protein LY11_03976 [Pedobacter cryoconitis]
MEKVQFTDQSCLRLQLIPPDFSRDYGVLHTYTTGEIGNTVKYNLKITYVKTIINECRIFRIERTSPVYVNDIEPDLIADQLAYECGKVFYPLMLEIDFDGEFIGVHNYSEIITRWSAQRVEIQDYFTGEFAEKYLKLMDDAVSTEEQVSEIFRNELFYRVFFAAIYKSYTNEFKVEETCLFPIAGSAAPVKFHIVQEVSPELNEAGKIQIIHHGHITDERSSRDLLEEQDFSLSHFQYPEDLPAKGSYTGLYRLDAETRSIFSAVAEWIVETEPVQKNQVKVFELMKEKEPEEVKTEKSFDEGMFFIDGNHKKTEKKFSGIFNLFLGK